MRWFATRRRRVVAAVGALALVGAVTIAIVTHSSGPTRAARPAAIVPTTAPATEPLAITPDVPVTSVPVTTTTQSPIADPPTVARAPATTAALSPPTAPKATAPLGGAVTLAPLPPGWATLASATGSATAQSKVFHLQDHNTRLRYVSSGSSLAVFVVDAKRGLDATAEYATADCAGACSDGWMSLHNPAGDYYLLVQATGGHWSVDISEYSGSV